MASLSKFLDQTGLTYLWGKIKSTFVPQTRTVNGKALSGNISLDASDVGLDNVANLDQSKAIKAISRSGTTFTYTCLDDTTGTFTQQDNNTWRGIQDNLTSDSTTESLSAAQGKALNNNKVAKSGDTMTGALLFDGGFVTYKASNIDINTTPSSSVYGTGYRLTDANNTWLGGLRQAHTTSNTVQVQLLAARPINGSTVTNSLALNVTSTGAQTVAVSSPSAWRSAIGTTNLTRTSVTLGNVTLDTSHGWQSVSTTNIPSGTLFVIPYAYDNISAAGAVNAIYNGSTLYITGPGGATITNLKVYCYYNA